MRKEQPISTAPKDGTKVTVVWMDDDDQRNESIAQYRDPARLSSSGGNWDDSDAGWWIYTDSKTQKRVDPVAWISGADDESEDEQQ